MQVLLYNLLNIEYVIRLITCKINGLIFPFYHHFTELYDTLDRRKYLTDSCV